MFLTKKFKEKKNGTFLKLFLNEMIRNIKITIFFIILRFQNLWNLINVFIKKIYENVH